MCVCSYVYLGRVGFWNAAIKEHCRFSSVTLKPRNSFKLTLFFCVWSLKWLTSCGIPRLSLSRRAELKTITWSENLALGATFGLVARLRGTHGSNEPRIHVYTARQGSLMWPESTWGDRKHTGSRGAVVWLKLYCYSTSPFSSQYRMYNSTWTMQRRAKTSVTCAV